jgi:hypothetical protein
VSYFIDDNQMQRDGSPESVHARIRKLAHEKFREEQRLVLENVTGLIIPGIVAEARKQGNAYRAFLLAEEAMEVIRDLDFALQGFNEREGRPWMWWHIKALPGLKNSSDRKYNTVSEELLEEAAAEYMARPWMQDDYIDWCIVDAAVHLEFFAYTRHVWNLRFLRLINFLFTVAFLGACLWGVWHGSSWRTPAALLFAVVAAGTVFTGIRRRWFRRDSSVALLMAMNDTYISLDGPVLSPSRVRAEIEAAKDKGVVWPRMIWPVIDTAVARDPNVWRVSPFQRR